MSARGDIARARSALEAAQSDLFIVQAKLAPLRQQEKRALDRVAAAVRHLRVLEGVDVAHFLAGTADAMALVELARIYEGVDDDATPCDVERAS